jgi:beta-galactosidase
VLDKNDQLQPNADNEISFGLTGAGSIAGLGSANMKSEEPYQGTQCRVFHGEALVVIRSNHQPGPIELQAHASGLADGLTAIRTTAAK